MTDNMCVAHAPRFTGQQQDPNCSPNEICLLRSRSKEGKAGPAMSSHEELETELRILVAEGVNFARIFGKDAAVREAYVATIREMSSEIRRSVLQGHMTPEQGASFASAQRNVIMESSRMKTTAVGRAMAKKLKGKGLELGELMEKYSTEKFSKSFKKLSALQKEEVFLEIIDSAGRDRPKFTAATKNLSRLSRGLWMLSGGIAIYNIASAEDKVEAAVEEGVSIGGGLAGGAAAGLAVSAVCGPGAPVCAIITVGIGSLIGSFTASEIYEHTKDGGSTGNPSGSGAQSSGGGGAW